MSTQLSLIPDDAQEKQRAVADLVRIADAMEGCEPGSRERKELGRAYKRAMVAAGITNTKGRVKGAKGLPKQKIDESRAAALQKVKEYLDNIRHWEVELPKLVTGEMGHIAISYLCNTSSGISAEIQFNICDSFYASYSGYKCTKAQVNFFMAKQLNSYHSIESGLIQFGMQLLKKADKRAFFDKYAVPYNERIKNQGNY